jgi:hypothetical protein
MFSDIPGKSYFYIDRIDEADRLVAFFPRVHEHAKATFAFQRTLRVPDDGRVYPLPAGLDPFPLRHLEDFKRKLPREWVDRGGVLMPMYRSEAMWIELGDTYPCAIKIGAGMINVLNGRPWTEQLDGSECDYLTAPPQAALDGYRTEDDVVRQFVAVRLGEGWSPEEQIAAEAVHGGIQIVAYPMRRARYLQLRAEHEQHGGDATGIGWGLSHFAQPEERRPHALAAGGQMRQRIFADPFGIDAWDRSARCRCIVTLIDVERWTKVTGALPTKPPFTPDDYQKAGLRWFEYYNSDLKPLEGPAVDPGQGPPADDDGAIETGAVKKLRPVRPPRRSRHPSPSVRAFWGAMRLIRG